MKPINWSLQIPPVNAVHRVGSIAEKRDQKIDQGTNHCCDRNRNVKRFGLLRLARKPDWPFTCLADCVCGRSRQHWHREHSAMGTSVISADRGETPSDEVELMPAAPGSRDGALTANEQGITPRCDLTTVRIGEKSLRESLHQSDHVPNRIFEGTTGPAPPHQLSRKLLRVLDRLGCFSFRSALASICLMRSRVNENCWPTSSSV
jgi:hypothetical protein